MKFLQGLAAMQALLPLATPSEAAAGGLTRSLRGLAGIMGPLLHPPCAKHASSAHATHSTTARWLMYPHPLGTQAPPAATLTSASRLLLAQMQPRPLIRWIMSWTPVRQLATVKIHRPSSQI